MPRQPDSGAAGLPATLLLALLPSLAAPHAFAADGGDEPAETRTAASIEDRLTIGLKARRPEDVAWLERVAGMVREGRMPAKVVDSTYLWALRRRQAYPFPSFRRALELQADRLGIEID